MNKNPKEFKSVSEYIKKQGRFKHLIDEHINRVIEPRDRKWERIRKNWI